MNTVSLLENFGQANAIIFLLCLLHKENLFDSEQKKDTKHSLIYKEIIIPLFLVI